MKKKIQGIYKIYNTITNKVYIGQSIDIEFRIKIHRRCSLNKEYNYPLYNSMRKYGMDAFEFSILEEVEDNLLLTSREQYYIDYFQSYIPEKGYNILQFASSFKGYKFSEETKKKISDTLKKRKITEEQRLRLIELSKKRKGIPRSEETKLKVSLAQKGKIISEETKQKMKEAWKYREPFSEEYKQNMSKILKGRILTKEWKDKIGKSNKGKTIGRKHSEEHKRKISEKGKGHIVSDETRKKIALSNKKTSIYKKFSLLNDFIYN